MKEQLDRDGTVPETGRLRFPRLLNVRDLGGLPTRDGGRTRPRSLLRSDDLWKLTPDGARDLLAYGVRTVIDLRWPQERRELPSVFERGVDSVGYQHISLLDESEEAWHAAKPRGPKELWNCMVLDYAGPGLAEALRAVAWAPSGVPLRRGQGPHRRDGRHAPGNRKRRNPGHRE